MSTANEEINDADDLRRAVEDRLQDNGHATAVCRFLGLAVRGNAAHVTLPLRVPFPYPSINNVFFSYLIATVMASRIHSFASLIFQPASSPRLSYIPGRSSRMHVRHSSLRHLPLRFTPAGSIRHSRTVRSPGQLHRSWYTRGSGPPAQPRDGSRHVHSGPRKFALAGSAGRGRAAEG